MNAGKRAEMAEALQALVVAVADRFAHEERLMVKHRFPKVARHCEAHRDFVADARRFVAQLAAKGVTPALRRWAVTRLLEWFRLHIVANDVELGRFLLVRERAPEAAAG